MDNLLEKNNNLIDTNKVNNLEQLEENQNPLDQLENKKNISENSNSLNNTDKEFEKPLEITNNFTESDNSSNNEPIPNSLFLTIKKDYNLFIIKNIILETLKNTFRITLSAILIILLKFFF